MLAVKVSWSGNDDGALQWCVREQVQHVTITVTGPGPEWTAVKSVAVLTKQPTGTIPEGDIVSRADLQITKNDDKDWSGTARLELPSVANLRPYPVYFALSSKASDPVARITVVPRESHLAASILVLLGLALWFLVWLALFQRPASRSLDFIKTFSQLVPVAAMATPAIGLLRPKEKLPYLGIGHDSLHALGFLLSAVGALPVVWGTHVGVENLTTATVGMGSAAEAFALSPGKTVVVTKKGSAVETVGKLVPDFSSKYCLEGVAFDDPAACKPGRGGTADLLSFLSPYRIVSIRCRTWAWNDVTGKLVGGAAGYTIPVESDCSPGKGPGVLELDARKLVDKPDNRHWSATVTMAAPATSAELRPLSELFKTRASIAVHRITSTAENATLTLVGAPPLLKTAIEFGDTTGPIVTPILQNAFYAKVAVAHSSSESGVIDCKLAGEGKPVDQFDVYQLPLERGRVSAFVLYDEKSRLLSRWRALADDAEGTAWMCGAGRAARGELVLSPTAHLTSSWRMYLPAGLMPRALAIYSGAERFLGDLTCSTDRPDSFVRVELRELRGGPRTLTGITTHGAATTTSTWKPAEGGGFSDAWGFVCLDDELVKDDTKYTATDAKEQALVVSRVDSKIPGAPLTLRADAPSQPKTRCRRMKLRAAEPAPSDWICSPATEGWKQNAATYLSGCDVVESCTPNP